MGFLIKHYARKRSINIKAADLCTLLCISAPIWTGYAQFWMEYGISDIARTALLIDTVAYVQNVPPQSCVALDFTLDLVITADNGRVVAGAERFANRVV